MKLFKSIAIVLAVLMSLPGCKPSESNHEYYLFVGTYTRKSSKGIYLYKFNADNGRIDSLGAATGIENPSYLTLSPDHDYLYAVNEMADSSKATVSSFAFDRKNERLTFLNKESSGGGAPCYISVDQTGRYAFVANYLGGSFSMFSIKDDGSLKKASLTVQHQGSSVNKDRQQSPHVHCTHLTPDNKFLIVDDLGTDHVLQYPLDVDTGTLKENPSYQYEAEAGAGPRHITFHPNGKYAYLITELKGLVVAFDYQDGKMEPMQTISALPENYDGRISGADIHVSPDGQFLYASMREDLNEIVIYHINKENGHVELVGRHSTNGVRPRNFAIDPTGKYLLAANMNSDNIVVFNRDQATGKLTDTGTKINISMPVCLKMIPAESERAD